MKSFKRVIIIWAILALVFVVAAFAQQPPPPRLDYGVVPCKMRIPNDTTLSCRCYISRTEGASCIVMPTVIMRMIDRDREQRRDSISPERRDSLRRFRHDLDSLVRFERDSLRGTHKPPL